MVIVSTSETMTRSIRIMLTSKMGGTMNGTAIESIGTALIIADVLHTRSSITTSPLLTCSWRLHDALDFAQHLLKL